MKRNVRRIGVLVRRHMRTVAHRVARALPRPAAQSQRDGTPEVTRVVVFARLPNPTVEYYLAARLLAPGMPPAEIVDIRHGNLADLDPSGAFVIICRYATRRILKWVDRSSQHLAGVGFFIDDDVGAVITGGEAKIGYRFFLYQRALAPLRRLNRHIDVVWTATPALAEALGTDRVHVMSPAPHPDIWKSSADEADAWPGSDDERPVRIVYHATGVHLREHAFLAPVIAAVLRERPNVVFEVTADDRARNHWSNLERVTVVPPTSWAGYLERTRRERADIALVPLLESRANRVRAGTKRVDVVRLGAAGVFSRSMAYGEDDGSGEILLQNRRKIWIRTILELVDDPELRNSAAAVSRSMVEAMGREAEKGIPGILTPLDRNPHIRHRFADSDPGLFRDVVPVGDLVPVGSL